MTTFLISGREIHSELDFHYAFKRRFDLPYYGKNLNALWDMLTGGIEKPVHLVWEHAAESRRHIGDERFDRLVQVLRKAEIRDRELDPSRRFTVDIQE